MRILIVDDYADVRAWVTEEILRHGDHEITEAVDGVDATVKIGEQCPFDAVITDMQMPLADGLYVLQWVNDSEVRPPCLLHSTVGTFTLDREAHRLGDLEKTFSFVRTHQKPMPLGRCAYIRTFLNGVEEGRRKD